MASQAQDKLYQEELAQFYQHQDNSRVAAALQAEYLVCLSNALSNLINGSADQREQHVGYYKAIQDVIAIEEKYKNVKLRPNSNE